MGQPSCRGEGGGALKNPRSCNECSPGVPHLSPDPVGTVNNQFWYLDLFLDVHSSSLSTADANATLAKEPAEVLGKVAIVRINIHRIPSGGVRALHGPVQLEAGRDSRLSKRG